jgi:hypothetical protein
MPRDLQVKYVWPGAKAWVVSGSSAHTSLSPPPPLPPPPTQTHALIDTLPISPSLPPSTPPFGCGGAMCLLAAGAAESNVAIGAVIPDGTVADADTAASDADAIPCRQLHKVKHAEFQALIEERNELSSEVEALKSKLRLIEEQVRGGCVDPAPAVVVCNGCAPTTPLSKMCIIVLLLCAFLYW